MQVLPNCQSLVQSSTVDGPSSSGIGPMGDQGQSDGMWARGKTDGRPDSPTSNLRRVLDTVPKGNESDIVMLPVDDAGCVQGASRHQSKAFGGPQPRVEDRESQETKCSSLKAMNDRFHYKELYYLVYGEFVKECNNILFLK